MSGFTTFADLKAEYAAGKYFTAPYYKSIATAGRAVRWQRTWNRGTIPAAQTEPSSTPGQAYTSHVGGLIFYDTAPDQKHLYAVSVSSGRLMSVMVYDRLVGVGGVSFTTTGDKTVNSVALPRYTTGLGVQACLEITTAFNAAIAFSLSSYTNDAGTSSRAGPSQTVTSTEGIVDGMVSLPLQAGDRGVRSVETINVSSTGGATTGTVNVVLYKPLALLCTQANHFGTNTNTENEVDYFAELSSMPRIYDGATLCFATCPSVNYSSVTDQITGQLRVVYG